MDVDVFLEHHGIKGMRWGNHKVKESSINTTQPSKSNGKRNAAIVLGSVAAATAVGVGAYYLKKHSNTKLSDIKKASEAAKKIVEEPTSVIHATRGKNHGFGFLTKGGLNDPLVEMEKAFGTSEPSHGTFTRYGDRLEKAAVVFNDPEGRKDRAGRVIPHVVLLPEHMAKNVGTFEAARRKAWVSSKGLFNTLYDSEFDR